MSIITPINSSSSTSGAQSAPTNLYSTQPTQAPTQTMNSQMFLQLLVTQLQNQDPSSPMDTNQMITQTTELAQMEQLTQMSSNSSSALVLQMQTSAAALIGQTVGYTDANGAAQSGTATAVDFSSTTPTVTVGSASVPLTSITSVTKA